MKIKKYDPNTFGILLFGILLFGILLFGPAVATHRFFDTLNRIETELNRQNDGMKREL